MSEQTQGRSVDRPSFGLPQPMGPSSGRPRPRPVCGPAGEPDIKAGRSGGRRCQHGVCGRLCAPFGLRRCRHHGSDAQSRNEIGNVAFVRPGAWAAPRYSCAAFSCAACSCIVRSGPEPYRVALGAPLPQADAADQAVVAPRQPLSDLGGVLAWPFDCRPAGIGVGQACDGSWSCSRPCQLQSLLCIIDCWHSDHATKTLVITTDNDLQI